MRSDLLSLRPLHITDPLNNPYSETQAPKTKKSEIGYQKR